MNEDNPLYIICKNNNTVEFKKLIQHNNFNMSATVIQYVTHFDCIDMVKILMENGFYDLNYINLTLNYVCSKGNLAIVKYLGLFDFDMEYGFNIACISGHLDIVKHLVNHCSVNPYCSHHINLEESVICEQTEIVNYLYDLYDDKILAQTIIFKHANDNLKQWFFSKLFYEQLNLELSNKNLYSPRIKL